MFGKLYVAWNNSKQRGFRNAGDKSHVAPDKVVE